MRKVMVIEDDKDIVHLVRVILEKRGFKVTEAFDGKEAYDKLSNISNEKEFPNLLLVDIMMPEMDGYTLYSKLQEHDRLKRIPAIILTAKVRMRGLFELSTNVLDFIDKPFEPDDLVQRINDAIDSQKQPVIC